MTQRTFGPEKRDGKWYFYAYIDGQQVELDMAALQAQAEELQAEAEAAKAAAE